MDGATSRGGASGLAIGSTRRLVLSALLHGVNILSTLLPQTRSFSIRSRLYRLAGVDIGDNVRINGGVVIQHANVALGSNSWIGRRSEFAPSDASDINIGRNCDVSQDVLFVSGSHKIGPPSRRAGSGVTSSISVGDGTWVGARALFLGGSSVGSGCIVAAGSLVRGEFPNNVLIGGVPAKVIRHLDEPSASSSISDHGS